MSTAAASSSDATRKNDDVAVDDDDDETGSTAAPKAPLSAEAKAAARAMQHVGAHDKSVVDDSKVDKAKVNAALQELSRKNAEARQRRLLE